MQVLGLDVGLNLLAWVVGWENLESFEPPAGVRRQQPTFESGTRGDHGRLLRIWDQEFGVAVPVMGAVADHVVETH
jgi:hypothetical protein